MEKDFSVCTYTITDKDNTKYSKWSDGLQMVIVKEGVTISLNEKEIEELVNTLPRTVGGGY